MGKKEERGVEKCMEQAGRGRMCECCDEQGKCAFVINVDCWN